MLLRLVEDMYKHADRITHRARHRRLIHQHGRKLIDCTADRSRTAQSVTAVLRSRTGWGVRGFSPSLALSGTSEWLRPLKSLGDPAAHRPA